MSVSNEHAEYKDMKSTWQMCEDAAKGQKYIHAASETYLPRLTDQTDSSYKAYRNRAVFYNATWRTIASMVGMIFRKDPVYEIPAGLEQYFDDVTGSGVPLSVFVRDITEKAINPTRVGVMVDYPTVDSVPRTVAEAISFGLRPVLKKYDALDIINWRVSTIANRTVLSLVVLKENHLTLKNEFTEESETRYRVLDISEASGYKYRVRVFKVDGKKDILLSENYPLMNGATMNFIPFVFIGSDDLSPSIDIPALIDLVYMNISHYQSTADREHGCHFTALPTAVISGVQPDENRSFYIGSESAWVFPDSQAKAEFLEFQGQGLGALENNLREKEQKMAVLGARLLEEQKKSVEAAETVGQHRKGEESILAGIASNVSDGLTIALTWMAQWAGLTGEVKYELNRDFFPVGVTPQMITAWMQLQQGGMISHEALFNNLKKNGFYPDDETFENEQARIANDPPGLNGIA